MKKLATEFRDALDKINWNEMPEGSEEFPKNCCHRISEVLAIYLKSKGIEGIKYIHCANYKFPSGVHCWLEVDGLAVDITADQFEEVNTKVIVQSRNIWHSQFGMPFRREPRYGTFSEPENSKLNIIYGAAMKNIKT
jgi:hypothetical protein